VPAAAVRTWRVATSLVSERGPGLPEQTLEIRTYVDGVERLPPLRPSYLVVRRTVAVPSMYQPQTVTSSLGGQRAAFASTEMMLAFPLAWPGAPPCFSVCLLRCVRMYVCIGYACVYVYVRMGHGMRPPSFPSMQAACARLPVFSLQGR
jgi:hypothetical protein